MKKILATAALATMSTIGFAAPATAQTSDVAGTCEFTADINIYVDSGEDIELPAGVMNTFHQSLCWSGRDGRLRIMKTVADTRVERRELVAMARKNAEPGYPVVLCSADASHATFIHYAWPYYAKVKRVTRYEVEHYAGWAERRAAKSDCSLVTKES